MSAVDNASRSNLAVLDLDVSRPELYRTDAWKPSFEKLRSTSPVHFTPVSRFGPYWSISSYDLVKHVESLPEIFSSASGMTIIDPEQAGLGPEHQTMFIAMDPPRHAAQRHAVAPAFNPSEMDRLAKGIRVRTGDLLDHIPLRTRFDWVGTVATELATQMLASLFDFPWDERWRLTIWSDWMSGVENLLNESRLATRRENVLEAGAYFRKLWQERLQGPPGRDLISLMTHSDATREMDDANFLGNLVLLIVGGNDTTRNAMSAMAYGLDCFPNQRERLEKDPSLVRNAASEIIRWQTPIAHMRRTATRDVNLGGNVIGEGEKVVLWYVSANRDRSVFGDDANEIVIDRPEARRHLAFGHGIHRCVGSRLAELQLSILMEELIARRLRVHVAAEPVRVADCFIHGYEELQVEVVPA